MGKTVDQLRKDIDRGKGGDKVPYPDPAAAPLGTDEEAAGTPIPQSAIDRAYRDEISKRPSHKGDGIRRK